MNIPKRVNNVDQRIGQNLRNLREAQSVTQEALAAKLGVTFQQVQKYEKGNNRISGSRLVQAANALNVPLTQLFEGADLKASPTGGHTHTPKERFEDIPGAAKFMNQVLALDTKFREEILGVLTKVVKSMTK
jgi:transcriptional regulator with XRE-family HTH domain